MLRLTSAELWSQPAGATGNTVVVAVSAAASVCACVSPPTFSGMLKLPSFARISSMGTTRVKSGSS